MIELFLTGNFWLKKIPKGWKLKALKRVSTLQSGLTLGKQYEGKLIERPYLRFANVQDGRLALENVTTIEVPPAIVTGTELKPDDVLMTEGDDLDKLGRGYLWEDQIPGCLHQNHLFAIRCMRHLLAPRFLAYATSSTYGRDYFEATGKRSTNLASTNATKVGAFPVPLPPLEEQDRLVAYLDKKIGNLDRLKENLNQQIQTLLAYRKSLIHECVTGKRRITEKDVPRVSKGTFNQGSRQTMATPELDYISVEGFKSIASVEKLALGPINLIIGPNGSGKSNFIGVFAFLHAIREGRLNDNVPSPAGQNSCCTLAPKKQKGFNYRLASAMR